MKKQESIPRHDAFARLAEADGLLDERVREAFRARAERDREREHRWNVFTISFCMLCGGILGGIVGGLVVLAIFWPRR